MSDITIENVFTDFQELVAEVPKFEKAISDAAALVAAFPSPVTFSSVIAAAPKLLADAQTVEADLVGIANDIGNIFLQKAIASGAVTVASPAPALTGTEAA